MSTHPLTTGFCFFSKKSNHIQTHVKQISPYLHHLQCLDLTPSVGCSSRLFLNISVVTSYSTSHGPQKASTASEGSHCINMSVRRRGQRNFQGIKYTMKHSKDSHLQLEKIWHNSDITKNWTPKLMKRQEEKCHRLAVQYM